MTSDADCPACGRPATKECSACGMKFDSEECFKNADVHDPAHCEFKRLMRERAEAVGEINAILGELQTVGVRKASLGRQWDTRLRHAYNTVCTVDEEMAKEDLAAARAQYIDPAAFLEMKEKTKRFLKAILKYLVPTKDSPTDAESRFDRDMQNVLWAEREATGLRNSLLDRILITKDAFQFTRRYTQLEEGLFEEAVYDWRYLHPCWAAPLLKIVDFVSLATLSLEIGHRTVTPYLQLIRQRGVLLQRRFPKCIVATNKQITQKEFEDIELNTLNMKTKYFIVAVFDPDAHHWFVLAFDIAPRKDKTPRKCTIYDSAPRVCPNSHNIRQEEYTAEIQRQLGRKNPLTFERRYAPVTWLQTDHTSCGLFGAKKCFLLTPKCFFSACETIQLLTSGRRVLAAPEVPVLRKRVAMELLAGRLMFPFSDE